jgi:hypothetical protein
MQVKTIMLARSQEPNRAPHHDDDIEFAVIFHMQVKEQLTNVMLSETSFSHASKSMQLHSHL